MFIKKDLRKIPEILEDQNDDRSDLFLARRSPEFKGNLDVLVESTDISKFKDTKYLSLNANMLQSIDGIRAFSKSPLTFLSLSNNKLNTLSRELSFLTSLESLIIEDNLLTCFPNEIRYLTNLKTLRLTRNNIQQVPEWIEELSQLEVLALDNCQIHTIPSSLSSLVHMKTLLLGNNNLQSIPPLDSMTELTMICFNSNQLTHCPHGLYALPLLTKIYANNNNIQEIEDEWSYKDNIELFNLKFNKITYLPTNLKGKWIENGNPITSILLEGNPIIEILASEVINLEETANSDEPDEDSNAKRLKK